MKNAPVISLNLYRLSRQGEESARMRFFRLALDLIREGDEEAIKRQIENAESELRRLGREAGKGDK